MTTRRKPRATSPAIAAGASTPLGATASDLNERQRRFVAEYLVDPKAGPAARRAGYSSKTAETCGSRLLRNPKVRAAVDAGLAKRLAKTGLQAERLDAELARITFADLGQAFGPDGDLLPMSEIPEDLRRALAGVDIEQRITDDGKTTVRTKRVKLPDKVAAIVTAYKRIGAFSNEGSALAQIGQDSLTAQFEGLQALLCALVQAAPSQQLQVPCAACSGESELELTSDGTTVTVRLKRPSAENTP